MELKRRRPVVGFTIGAGQAEGTVVVEKTEKDGPAAKAGIRVGDLIVETDGLKIRSAYQAIGLIVKKQPGDQMTFTVQRGSERQKFELTLDGGAAPAVLSPVGKDSQVVLVGPQLKVHTTEDGQIMRRAPNGVAEVAVTKEERRSKPASEPEMLRKQLDAYQRVIEGMQQEIEALRRETNELRKQASERK